MRVLPIRYCVDIEASTRFYRALGLELGAATRPGSWVELPAAAGILALHRSAEHAGECELAFEADEPLEAVVARLADAGFPAEPIVDESFCQYVPGTRSRRRVRPGQRQRPRPLHVQPRRPQARCGGGGAGVRGRGQLVRVGHAAADGGDGAGHPCAPRAVAGRADARAVHVACRWRRPCCTGWGRGARSLPAWSRAWPARCCRRPRSRPGSTQAAGSSAGSRAGCWPCSG